MGTADKKALHKQFQVKQAGGLGKEQDRRGSPGLGQIGLPKAENTSGNRSMNFAGTNYNLDLPSSLRHPAVLGKFLLLTLLAIMAVLLLATPSLNVDDLSYADLIPKAIRGHEFGTWVLNALLNR